MYACTLVLRKELRRSRLKTTLPYERSSITKECMFLHNLWSSCMANRVFAEQSVAGFETNDLLHGLRTPREEIAFTARPKIHSHSQIFRYGRSIFCLPHRPKFSDFFDLCLHWVSIVRGLYDCSGSQCCRINWHFYVICDEININIFCDIMSACFCSSRILW